MTGKNIIRYFLLFLMIVLVVVPFSTFAIVSSAESATQSQGFTLSPAKLTVEENEFRYYEWDEDSNTLYQKKDKIEGRSGVTLNKITSNNSNNIVIWGTAGKDTWYYVSKNVTFSGMIVCKGNVHLILKDGVTFTVKRGIAVGEKQKTIANVYDPDNGKDVANCTVYPSTLNIYGQSDDTSNSSNVGKLYAGTTNGSDFTSYIGASGIGGYGLTDDDVDGSCGNITIHGGNIIARGSGNGAAAIGSGVNGISPNITIYGGIIDADVDDSGGAGIGTGAITKTEAQVGKENGILKIYGGKICAQGSQTIGYGGAGIGGGRGSDFGKIYIYGGDITAIGGRVSEPTEWHSEWYGAGAGIGGGAARGNSEGACGSGTVYIYGGNINATGGMYAYTENGIPIVDIVGAAIGGGGQSIANDLPTSPGGYGYVMIYGGNVTANGPIGGGCANMADAGDGTVSIMGGTIIANNEIGGGNSVYGSGGDGVVKIEDGNLTAYGEIGGGNSVYGKGGDAIVEVLGGMVDGVGIGGGNSVYGDGGSVTKMSVSGGTLLLSEGLGGGDSVHKDGGDVGEMLITGGTLIMGAIGGGDTVNGDGGSIDNITIDNVIVHAGTIGGGSSETGNGGNIGTITITNGELILDAGNYDGDIIGGIGGGATQASDPTNSKNGGDVENIIINHGTIEALFIGGGTAIQGNGGNVKYINISNNSTLTVYGSIGGGDTEIGDGGNVTQIYIADSIISADSVGGGTTVIGNGGMVGDGKEENYLIVTSGVMNVTGTIGGGDTGNGTGGQAYIRVDSGTLSAANIGGGNSVVGNGGGAYIRINDGTLNADNIGGGDTVHGEGGVGSITVYDGLLNAGTIGGGYSEDVEGGLAIITVHSGTLIADTVSGGDTNSGTGGLALITVNGGNFNITDKIAGGSSQTGNGGECMATFTGGTIRANEIGAGFSTLYGYAESDIDITGGSLNAKMTTQPTNGVTNGYVDVYQTAITLYNADKRVEGSPQISNLTTDLTYTYGLNDVHLDESAMLYLWLPENSSVTEIDVENVSGTFAGVVRSMSSGPMRYMSSKNYYSVYFPFDDRYTVSYDKEGTIQISGVWAAAMGEAVSFYVHPKEYAPGHYYDISAFRSNDETYTMDIFGADSSSTDALYYFKMTVISDTHILIAAADDTGNRLSLDLSQNSVVLNDGYAAMGGYLLNTQDVTEYMLTSGGLPTPNTLRVESGEHDLYVNWIDSYSPESIVNVSGGAVNLSVSDTDNKIIATENSPIYLANGAILNLSLSGVNSLKLGCEAANLPIIGGEGSVYIQRTDGFGYLSMSTYAEDDIQIIAREFAYKGPVQAGGGIPYRGRLIEGEFVGFLEEDGVVVGNADVLDETKKYTAFSVTYQLPTNFDGDITHTITGDGKFIVNVPEGYYANSLYHNGKRLKNISSNTLDPSDCHGDLFIFIVRKDGITYLADDVTVEYNGHIQRYPEIIVEAGSDVKRDSIKITYGLSENSLSPTIPGQKDVGNYTIYYSIEYTLVNDTVIQENGSVHFKITAGVNEWILELICGTIIKGETPHPHAEAKLGNDELYFLYRSYDTETQTWSDWTETPPTEAGLHDVKAIVPADADGNYDRLESDTVLFVIDPAAIFYTLGKEYTKGYQGYENGVVELDKFKNFTVYYSYYYTPDRRDNPLTFLFTTTGETPQYTMLPAGTVITLLCYDNIGMKAYYYRVTGNEAPEGGIVSTYFINMGSMLAGNGFELSTTVPTQSTIKISIELPEDYNDSFNILLKQGGKKGYVTPDIEVKNAAFADAKITIDEEVEQKKGSTFATVVIDNVVGNENVIAIEVFDGNSNIISISNAMSVYIDGGDATFAGISGGRIFFSGMANGSYTIGFGLNELISADTDCTLRAYLCECPETPLHSMDACVDTDERDVTVTVYNTSNAPTISVSSTKRAVTEDEGINLTVTYKSEVPDGTELSYSTYRVDGTIVTPYTLNGMPEGFKSGINTHISLEDVPNGTYIILFDYGGITYRFSFIVTE